MKVSTSSVKNGAGRSISEAVWLSLVGFAASSAAQAKSAEAPEAASRAAPLRAEGVAAAALQDAGQDSAELAAQDQILPGEADLAAQDLAGQELFADADGQHLSALIDQYMADEASSQAFASSSEAAEEVADLMPKAGAFDKLAQGQSYKVAQAGTASVAAPAMGAAALDPMLALLGLGGVVLVAAAGGSSDDAAPTTPTTADLSGVAIDGYLFGSTVFYDADGDGVKDEGEVETATLADGSFKLLGVTKTAAGRLVVEDGTDILTGRAFTGQLVSNSNAATGIVISPITSLLASGISPEALKAALGLTLPANIDLATFDPIAALHSTTQAHAGESVLVAAQQVFTAISTLVAKGVAPDSLAAAKSLAGALSQSGASLNSAVSNLLGDSDAATALNSINDAIAQNLGGGNLVDAFAHRSAAELTDIMKSVVVAQTTFIEDVKGGTELATKYSGDSLAAEIDVAQVELSTGMYSLLKEGGFDLTGAEFDSTIDRAIAKAIHDLYPADVDFEHNLDLEIIGCQ
jgi:hypothetical protein